MERAHAGPARDRGGRRAHDDRARARRLHRQRLRAARRRRAPRRRVPAAAGAVRRATPSRTSWPRCSTSLGKVKRAFVTAGARGALRGLRPPGRSSPRSRASARRAGTGSRRRCRCCGRSSCCGWDATATTRRCSSTRSAGGAARTWPIPRRPIRRWSAWPSSSGRCAATARCSTSTAGAWRRPRSPPTASGTWPPSATSASPPSSTRRCASRSRASCARRRCSPSRSAWARSVANEARPYRFFTENYDAVQKKLPPMFLAFMPRDRDRLLGGARGRRARLLRRPEAHGCRAWTRRWPRCRRR